MRKIIIIYLLLALAFQLAAQNTGATYQFPGTNLWLGSYNKFRLTDKFFWWAEFHYRRANFNSTPFVGRMAQLYNRHAISYLASPTINMSWGGVLRLDFTPEPGNDIIEPVIHEPRIWHEYLFIIPWPSFQIYHRIRIEHRWSKAYGSQNWDFRNRWRYMFYAKIPLNNKKLVPGTFYFSPSVEVILQNGKTVVNSILEDLRLYPSIAYIVNPRVSYSMGVTYTVGQTLRDGSIYRQRWLFRVNAYISVDLRKDAKKIPTIRSSD